MKEVERIITAQITVIEVLTDEDADSVIASQEEARVNITADLQKMYNADDVVVTVQDVMRDKVSSDDFKRYVDRHAKDNNISVEEALQHKIVKETEAYYREKEKA